MSFNAVLFSFSHGYSAGQAASLREAKKMLLLLRIDKVTAGGGDRKTVLSVGVLYRGNYFALQREASRIQ